MKIILATGNPGKVREFADLFAAYDIEIALPETMPDVDENGASFTENARIKAKALYDLCGETVLADDSGLCVDALDGRPGIYSARYAEPGKRRQKVNGVDLHGLQVSLRGARQRFSGSGAFFLARRPSASMPSSMTPSVASKI